MDFADALKALKEGYRVTNCFWNGKEMYLAAQMPDEHSANTQPYIYIQMPKDHPIYPGGRTPWTPSQLDLFSSGWQICGPEAS
jgi:hypothetical protein